MSGLQSVIHGKLAERPQERKEMKIPLVKQTITTRGQYICALTVKVNTIVSLEYRCSAENKHILVNKKLNQAEWRLTVLCVILKYIFFPLLLTFYK